MKKLHFETTIKASRQRIWNVLWDDATYRQWTSAFKEGSYAVSDWKEGSRIKFLSPTGEGMYSQIERLVPWEFMSFRHLGEIRDGKEQPWHKDQDTEGWNGAHENYTLTEMDGHTKLIVEINSTDEFVSYLNDVFPKALAKVKEIAESSVASN